MPAILRKLKSGKYMVKTPNMVHSKGTSKKKAQAQQRLLNAIEYNPKFKPRKKKK